VVDALRQAIGSQQAQGALAASAIAFA
jgi:hypothetical protein